MKKLIVIFVLCFISLNSSLSLAENITLECKFETYGKDYITDNIWKEYPSGRYKLKINDGKIVLYDYELNLDYTPAYIIRVNNSNYITATGIENRVDGAVATIMTYTKSNGYVVFMNTDYEFGLTINSGYCM